MTPYYEEPGIQVYHGDNREILPQLPPADLIITSPPYNLGTTTGGGFADNKASEFVRNHGHYRPDAPLGKARGGAGKLSGGALASGYGDFNDALPMPEYEERQRAFLKMCWSRLTDTGAIFYNHKPRVQSCEAWLPLRVNPELPLRQIITWARAGGINFAPTHYVPMYEWILVFAKPAFRLRDKAASGAGDLWYIPQESNTEHPAPFPLGLPLRILETTKPGIVIDPHCGSGTTLRAAKDMGRVAYGIDINEKYCEIAARRLSQGALNLEATA